MVHENSIAGGWSFQKCGTKPWRQCQIMYRYTIRIHRIFSCSHKKFCFKTHQKIIFPPNVIMNIVNQRSDLPAIRSLKWQSIVQILVCKMNATWRIKLPYMFVQGVSCDKSISNCDPPSLMKIVQKVWTVTRWSCISFELTYDGWLDVANVLQANSFNLLMELRTTVCCEIVTSECSEGFP